MGFPRSAYTFREREPKPIDGRATRRDISGKVISEPGEKAYTGVHRGMSGEALSGTSLRTGARHEFPAPAGGGFPKPLATESQMTTGNPRVTFKSPAQMAAESGAMPKPTAAAKSAVFEAGRRATLATRPDLQAEAGPRPVGAGTMFPRSRAIVSPHGMASVTTAPRPSVATGPQMPKPLATKGRIFDETGDVTAKFAKPSAPAPGGMPRKRVASAY